MTFEFVAKDYSIGESTLSWKLVKSTFVSPENCLDGEYMSSLLNLHKLVRSEISHYLRNSTYVNFFFAWISAMNNVYFISAKELSLVFESKNKFYLTLLNLYTISMIK